MADSMNLQIIIDARDDASEVIIEIKKAVDDLVTTMFKTGKPMFELGADMAGFLVSAVKSAEEERMGVERLRTAMINMGIDYDTASDMIERQIELLESKTNYADSEQRDSLATLVLSTGDVTQAMDYLKLSMDIAAGTGTSLQNATGYVTMALAGNWDMLQTYIPALKQATTEEEKWTMLQEMFNGQAENTVSIFTTMQNSVNDIVAIMGEAWRPVIEFVGKALKDLTGWMKEHEGIVKGVSYAVGTLAIGLMAVGTGLMAAKFVEWASGIPDAIKGLWSLITMITSKVIPALIALNALMGPKGWAILAASVGVGFLAYAGIKTWMDNQAVAQPAQLNMEAVDAAFAKSGTNIEKQDNSVINNYNFDKGSVVVREDADIDRIAESLFNKQQRQSLAGGK